MIRTMSLTTRRELLDSVRQRYENANRIDKGRVLDGFVAATGYDTASETEPPRSFQLYINRCYMA
jgi:hypothetical protein